MRQRLLMYDLDMSFGIGRPGRAKKRLVNADGGEHLDADAWKAGDIAYQALTTNSELNEREFVAAVEMADGLLCNDLYPAFLARIDRGEIHLDGGSREQFVEWWKDYDWVQRLMILLPLLETNASWRNGGEQVDLRDELVALAVLWRLDDAGLAESFGGSGLASCVRDIEVLKNRLQVPRHLSDSIDDAFKHAGSHLARKGGRAKHEKSNAARGFVQAEWQLHSHAYVGNKSAFARDYVRRVKNEFAVTVTEKQMREVWLKDPPSACRPDGLLADGE